MKLKLKELEINSFTTSVEQHKDKLKGGTDSLVTPSLVVVFCPISFELSQGIIACFQPSVASACVTNFNC